LEISVLPFFSPQVQQKETAAVGKVAESICSHVVLQIYKKYWVVYLCLHQNRGMHEMLGVCRVFV